MLQKVTYVFSYLLQKKKKRASRISQKLHSLACLCRLNKNNDERDQVYSVDERWIYPGSVIRRMYS